MADREAVRRSQSAAKRERAQSKPLSFAGTGGASSNDNPVSDDLPTCLEVTDEEVSLLHRYLGQQILGLFS
jgi:hypothetical protein